jgi:hypothetical protein
VSATSLRARDSDLAEAAGGDAGAYANLYHRHIEAAWRLAQATAPSADAAAKATTNAFVRVVRLVGRGRDDVADQFRHHLLAAVYRDARSGSDQSRPAGTRDSGVIASFGKLPARWRAALWLQEVEQIPATVAGPILGVSSAAAVQLKKRALGGLEHRVVQSGGSLPLPDLATALAATMAPLPREVQAKTEARWKRTVGRDRRSGGWVGSRASGPLALCAASLCVAGLVGLAVVSPKTVQGHFAAAPAPAPAAAAPAAAAPAAGTTAPAASASGTAATKVAQGPQLVATQPAAVTPVTVATTVAPVTVALVPVTVPTTLPPITAPPTRTPTPVVAPPPVVTPPVPAAASTPIVQVGLNLGVVAVNVGLGPNSCTGVNLLGIKVGCTTGGPGLSLGGALLGGK